MARPIKCTPVVRGKDAVRLRKEMEENMHKKVDKAYIDRIEESYKKIFSLLKTKDDKDQKLY